MRHRRRTAAQRRPPIPASLSLVPPTAPRRRSRPPTPRPPRSIQALGLHGSRRRLCGPGFTPRLPGCPYHGRPRLPAHLRNSSPPSPAAVPSVLPPPLAVSPRPTPQWRSRQPLEGRVVAANHRDALAPTSVLGRRWTGALPGAHPGCRTCLPPGRCPWPRACGGGGVSGGAPGAVPNGCDLGRATRGLFENSTVGVGGLGSPAAVRRGRYTWQPGSPAARPPRPHKDGGQRPDRERRLLTVSRGPEPQVKCSAGAWCRAGASPRPGGGRRRATSGSDLPSRRGARPRHPPARSPRSLAHSWHCPFAEGNTPFSMFTLPMRCFLPNQTVSFFLRHFITWSQRS